MNNLEKIKRYLSKPIPITIKNMDGAEDVFYFKPLNIEQQAILLELSKVIRNRGSTEVEIEENGKIIKQNMPDVNKEDMENMFDLIKNIVKNSFSDIDEKTLEDFCNTNFEQLSDALFKLIPQNQNKEDVNMIKKRVDAIKDGKSGTANKY